jgi:hypothetical protein
LTRAGCTATRADPARWPRSRGGFRNRAHMQRISSPFWGLLDPCVGQLPVDKLIKTRSSQLWVTDASARGAKQVKRLNRSRYALSVCAVAILLAGCGGSFNTPSTVTAAMPETARTSPASGGAFSGGYSGSFSFTICHGLKSKGVFRFSGTGLVSFLGPSRESGRLHSHQYARPYDCTPWSGSVTLTSSKDPSNSISMSLKERIPTPNPCQPYPYKVTSGTGKFANATGSGTVELICRGMRGTYSDQWSGTISF